MLQLKDQKSILNTAGAGPNLRVQFTATVAISSLVTVAVPTFSLPNTKKGQFHQKVKTARQKTQPICFLGTY
ncbi:MAG: hypothetical protein ACQEXK_17305 [Bacillota bacterium]